MRDAGRLQRREADDRVGEMRRVRRTSALIVDDAQRTRSFVDLIADGLDEVRAVHAKEPRRAHDQMLLRVRGRELAEQLGAAVGGEGIGRVVDVVRRALLAIEHEVGGDLHQQRADVVGCPREELDRRAVDGVGDPLFLFRFVDFRVRGAVDDDGRLALAHERGDGARVGDVEVGLRQRDRLFAARGELAGKVAPDHASRTGDEPAHERWGICTLMPLFGAINCSAWKA